MWLCVASALRSQGNLPKADESIYSSCGLLSIMKILNVAMNRKNNFSHRCLTNNNCVAWQTSLPTYLISRYFSEIGDSDLSLESVERSRHVSCRIAVGVHITGKSSHLGMPTDFHHLHRRHPLSIVKTLSSLIFLAFSWGGSNSILAAVSLIGNTSLDSYGHYFSFLSIFPVPVRF